MTKPAQNITRKPRQAMRTPVAETQTDPAGIDDSNAAAGADLSTSAPVPASRPTKTTIVLDLMRREQGALLADIVAATGWQPHTARAALTGLRKRGHAIASTKLDKVTCYKLA